MTKTFPGRHNNFFPVHEKMSVLEGMKGTGNLLGDV